MKKEPTKRDSVIVVLAGLVLIAMSLFTSYTLSFSGFVISQQITLVIGIVVVLSGLWMGFGKKKGNTTNSNTSGDHEEE